MSLWLLLIIISQLWCLVSCPPVPGYDPDCKLAAKTTKTPQYEVLVRHKNIRRLFRMETTTKKNNFTKALRDDGDGSGVSITTAMVPNGTREYWNVTNERCDYERIRCMRAYATGAVCARTLYYQYFSFPNYCALDYHNCIGRYDNIWTLAYMGICTELDIERELYVEMGYDQMTNVTFLTQMYPADSGDLTNVG